MHFNVILLVWGPPFEKQGLRGVTISASLRRCPVARNPAPCLPGIPSQSAVLLRSKIRGTGLIHSFIHSNTHRAGFSGSGAMMKANGPGSHPQGLTVHRERGPCSLESQAESKRDTALTPSPDLREGPPLCPGPASCVSSPARSCTFHTRMQTPAVDSIERSRPGHPC